MQWADGRSTFYLHQSYYNWNASGEEAPKSTHPSDTAPLSLGSALELIRRHLFGFATKNPRREVFSSSIILVQVELNLAWPSMLL